MVWLWSLRFKRSPITRLSRMVCPQECHGRLTLFILRCQCAWDAPTTDNPQFDCPIRYIHYCSKLFFEHPSSPRTLFFPHFHQALLFRIYMLFFSEKGHPNELLFCFQFLISSHLHSFLECFGEKRLYSSLEG